MTKKLDSRVVYDELAPIELAALRDIAFNSGIKRQHKAELAKRYRAKQKRLSDLNMSSVHHCFAILDARAALDSRYTGFGARYKCYNEACAAGIVFW